MLVREVMTTSPVTITADTTVKAALILLDRHGITAMPVVGPDDRIVGVVSEADLISEAVPRDSRAQLSAIIENEDHRLGLVEDVMTRYPMTMHPTSDLAEATHLMTTTAVKSLPVVDSRMHVVGVISRRDIVGTLAHTDEHIEREVDELLRLVGRDWLVDVTDGVVEVSGPASEADERLATTVAHTVAGVVAVHIAHVAHGTP